MSWARSTPSATRPLSAMTCTCRDPSNGAASATSPRLGNARMSDRQESCQSLLHVASGRVMNDLASRRSINNLKLSALPSLAVALFWAGNAFADLAVPQVQIASPAPKSRVPEVTRQGRLLAPQAICAVDVAADGKVITIGTMAFSHDANVWQFSPEGTVISRRHFPPWAPMQVATLA